MVNQYLIDTNPVIDFFNGKLSAEGKKLIAAIEPAISVITHIELLSNKNIPSKEWQQIHDFIQIAVIYALESQIVEQTIILRQNYKIKTPDAIIAATAIVYGFTLISRNVADFKNISALRAIDPYTI
jgi:predicted nucleic acid-binding protein